MPPEANYQSLSGAWKFTLDPEDRGRTEQWFRRPEIFTATAVVPGAFQAQGLGDNRYCTPLCQARGIPPMVMENTSYLGSAWYQREFSVPDAWRDKTLLLVFGGTHPVADLWVDDQFVATHAGSFLEHRHDITPFVTAGGTHTLTVRIAEFERTLQTNQRVKGAVEGGTFNLTTWSGIWRDVKRKVWYAGDCGGRTTATAERQAGFPARLWGRPALCPYAFALP